MNYNIFHNSNGTIDRKPNLHPTYSIHRNLLLEVLMEIAETNDVTIYHEH